MSNINDQHIRWHGESIDDFMIRLAENMNAYGLKWQDIADLLNSESGDVFSESRWRKRCKTFNQGRMYERKRGGNDMLLAQARELEKQKIGLAEQRAAIKRAIREDAQRDAVMDEIRENFKNYEPIQVAPTNIQKPSGEDVLVVGLSDLHIGIDFANKYGCYNSDVAKARLGEYASHVIAAAHENNTSRCVVALLGDLLSGGAHVQIRIENRENYMEQIKVASELVAQFVSVISSHFESVDVYGTPGNHSRAIQNEKDALVSECFDSLIPWYVSARLWMFYNVKVHTEVDIAGVTAISVGGVDICLVHGHMDSLDEKSVAKLNAMCGRMFKYIFCGHLHECEYKAVMGTRIIRGGSLCGSGDDYTLKNRLSGQASQIMTVIGADGKIKALLPVEFE